jgi:hypothetical protein
LRAELHALAAAELEEVNDIWQGTLLPEVDQPLTQQERDELAADTYKKTELMRRQEHACLREFLRLGTLLMKLQAQGSSEEPAKAAKKHDSGIQPASGRQKRAEGPGRGGESTTPTATPKYEGASGDVDENTGGSKSRGAEIGRKTPQKVVNVGSGRPTATARRAAGDRGQGRKAIR